MNRGQAFLLFLIAVVSLLALVIVLPFFEFVLAAVILAYVLYPIHGRLQRRIGPFLSPIALILGSLLAGILPIAYITLVFVRDLTALARGESELDVVAIEMRVVELTGREVDLTGVLSAAGQQLIDVLFGNVGGFVQFTLKASLGSALVLFLVYYLLREGPVFVVWLRDTTPLPPPVTQRLFDKIDRMTWGVVIGHISVAFLQAVIAGVGFWAVGIPDVVFWTFVMAVLALLPLIGAFLVWGPAAAYLVLIDQATAGILLAVYGVVVVSMVDNYARPIVIDQQAHLNPGVILVGVFGGVYSIGFTGLFVGPIVVGVLAATLDTFREDFDRLGGE